jgi:hypothetical protein
MNCLITKTLNEEEQERLLLLAEENSERDLIKLIAKPEPEGFNLKVGKTTLHRFLENKKAERMEKEVEELSAQARRIWEKQERMGVEFEAGTVAVLRQRLFEEARRVNKTADVSAMYRLILDMDWKRKRHELACKRSEISEEYLKLARERFQFNAARMALECLDELQAIMDTEEIDNEEKILRARERLFGKEVIAAINDPRAPGKGSKNGHQ